MHEYAHTHTHTQALKFLSYLIEEIWWNFVEKIQTTETMPNIWAGPGIDKVKPGVCYVFGNQMLTKDP